MVLWLVSIPRIWNVCKKSFILEFTKSTTPLLFSTIIWFDTERQKWSALSPHMLVLSLTAAVISSLCKGRNRVERMEMAQQMHKNPTAHSRSNTDLNCWQQMSYSVTITAGITGWVRRREPIIIRSWSELEACSLLKVSKSFLYACHCIIVLCTLFNAIYWSIFHICRHCQV